MKLIRVSFICILAFVVAGCGGGNNKNESQKKLGIYNLEGNSLAFKIWRDGDRLCDKIGVVGDINSAVLAENGGINFIDSEQEQSFIEVYPQDKRCFEAEIFLKLILQNNLSYVIDDYGQPEITEVSTLSASLKSDLELKLNNLYSDFLQNKNYPVRYLINSIGRISEDTEANYYYSMPAISTSVDLGFSYYAATTFGLRLFKFGSNGAVAAEYGDYNTAFYNVIQIGGDLYVSTGFKRIDVLDKDNLLLKRSIEGKFVSSMHPYKEGALVVAYDNEEDWKKGRLYYLNVVTGIFTQLSDINIRDSRGIIVWGGKIYVTSGYDKKIIIFDEMDFSREIWYGFRYPNGLSVGNNGDLLVGDEHAGVVRNISLEDRKLIKSFGFGILASPSIALVLERGTFQGEWLVADTDNNRIIIINPNTKKINYEVKNVRSAMNLWILR